MSTQGKGSLISVPYDQSFYSFYLPAQPIAIGLIVLDHKRWYFMLLSSSKEEATPMYNLKTLDY